MNGTVPMQNGIDSDQSSVSDHEVETIPSLESLDDFMSLDNIELAISQVTQLLSYDRGRNGLMVHQEFGEFEDTIGQGARGDQVVFERGDQMKNLCQELVFLLSEDGQDIDFSDSIIPEETARTLVQWLLKYIPDEKHDELIHGTSLSYQSEGEHTNISQSVSETGAIQIAKENLDRQSSNLSNSVPHLPVVQTDSDYPSTTTSASGINEYLPQGTRTKSDPSCTYLSATMPRNFRDRASTTPIASLAPGYLSDMEDSGHYKRSYTLPKDGYVHGESQRNIEFSREFVADGLPPRPKTCTPEPWLSLEDQTPVFKRKGSLRKLTRAIGKLRRVDRADKVVILGSNSTVLVMDQPHRREFLSRDANGVVEWLVSLGLEQYSNRIIDGRINSCALLKLAIDGKLENTLSLTHPLHRKKLELALEETLKYGTTELSGLSYKWVLNWLEMNGLADICPNFEQARIDGRMLHMLTFDDLTLLSVEDNLYQLSLKSAIKVLRLTSFSPNYLDSREIQDNCLYWSCPHVSEWVSQTLKLRNTDSLKTSGLNGAFMMLEDSFTGNTLAEIIDIPKSKSHLRSVVKEEFMKVIGPHCAQHKLDKSKTKNFLHLSPVSFKAKKRASMRRGYDKKSLSRDGTRLLCPLIFEPNSNSPCFQGNLSVFQGLIDSYIYSATDLDTPRGDQSVDIASLFDMSQLSRVVTNEDGDILV